MNSIKKTSCAYTKLPAYGKALLDLHQLNNPPYLIAVCVGKDCWNHAKEWQKSPDVAALVLTQEQSPSTLQWPVNGCFCLIEWGGGAGESLVIELVKCLLKSSALSVTVRPLWIDIAEPAGYYENGQWIQTREMIHTYFPRKVSNVA